MAVTALSYAASKTVTAPLERVKLILQVGPILKTEQQFTGILKTFSTVYSTQGLLAFWRGNAMNIFKTVPNAALRFTAYDKFKQYSSEYRKKETVCCSINAVLQIGDQPFSCGSLHWGPQPPVPLPSGYAQSKNVLGPKSPEPTAALQRNPLDSPLELL